MDGCRAESGGVAVSGNTITDAPYCAITCGGGPHIVERNRIRRCMTVLHDGAAIYCSRGRRTVIRGNYVSEISGRAAHACYFDEMSSLCVCEGNVFIDIENVVNNHLSSHCVYRNNFFFCHGTMRVALLRSAHFLFEENIFAATEAVCFESSFMANEIRWDFKDVLQLRANLVWAPAGIRYRSSLNYGERPLYDGDFPPNPGVIRLNPNVIYTPEGAPVVAEDSPLRWLGVSAPDVHEAGAHE